MAILVNLRHLEGKSIGLNGEASAAELDMQILDELIKAPYPVRYELTVQLLNGAIVVQGRLEMVLECECSRCLKAFSYRVLVPDYAAHVALSGEEGVEVRNDCVDLTPFLREDILLALPQYPLCGAECSGLASTRPRDVSDVPGTDSGSTAWEALNKLRL